MSSPERAFYLHLVAVADALKTAGELELVVKGRPIENAPTAPHARRGLGVIPLQTIESTGAPEDELAAFGPLQWKGEYQLTAWVSDFGGDTDRDLVAGSAELPSVLDVAARIRDAVAYNLARAGCSWSWPATVYSFLGEWPRQRATMTLRIELELPVFNRAGGSFPPPTLPPVSSFDLGDLADVDLSATPTGHVLRHDGSSWVDVLLTLGDLLASTTAGAPLVGNGSGGWAEASGVRFDVGSAPLNLPTFAGDPAAPVAGGTWLSVVGGSLYLKHKRTDTGAIHRVALEVSP